MTFRFVTGTTIDLTNYLPEIERNFLAGQNVYSYTSYDQPIRADTFWVLLLRGQRVLAILIINGNQIVHIEVNRFYRRQKFASVLIRTAQQKRSSLRAEVKQDNIDAMLFFGKVLSWRGDSENLKHYGWNKDAPLGQS